MKVIQCDKCEKILNETSKKFCAPDLDYREEIDLCEECYLKYKDMKKEYSSFEEEVRNMYSLTLKAKRREINEKYFGDGNHENND